MSIREVGDAVKVHCFVCLDRDRVLAAVGLTWQDVTPFRDTGGWTNHTRTWQRPTVKPVPPRPKAELDRILDAFWTAGMTWRATPRLGVYRCECPLCRDPWLSVWVFSYDHEDDRAGCPAQVTCSNGCDPKEIARALVPDPDLLALRQSGWAA